MISQDDLDTVGVKATSRPLPGWWMHDHFLHKHPQNLVLLGGAGAIPFLLNDRFALRCGDRHQAEAILSAETFDAKDLIRNNSWPCLMV